MIKITFDYSKNRAVANDQGNQIGICSFNKHDKYWEINHTLVDQNYRGQGIASLLVKEVVDKAREYNVRILPVCSYAVKEFKTKSEYSDILFEEI